MAEPGQAQFLLQGDVYEVEKLVGIKIEDGRKLYKIRWKGYSAQSDTYEPEENLLSCKDMIAELEENLEKKKARKFSKNAQLKLTEQSEELLEEGQKTIDPTDMYKDQSKDTFWIDFNAGKINVFGQDMYSKVKERAARSVSQTTGDKPAEAPVKDIPPLICPKVVLKRRTSPKNAVPTYRSSLHLKPLTIGVKKRKKYDVLRDYRRRKYRSSRKRNADENKQLNGNTNDILYQNLLKGRVLSCAKPVLKNEIQAIDSTSTLEYLKVLQELPANDEVSSNDGLDYTTLPLPTSVPPKILLESEAKAARNEELKLKEGLKAELRRSVGSVKETHKPPESIQSPIATSHLSFLNNLSSKIAQFAIVKKECSVSQLNVVSPYQANYWKSMKLKESLEKIISMEKGTHTTNRHMFDLLLAASLQGRLDITDKLCSRGASLNHVLSDGTTMIMILSQMGLHDVVRIFLKYNGHKDLQNQYGETALMLACRHKHPKVVKILLEHGANFALTNVEGINALRVFKKYAEDTDVSNIMNEHISRMKLEFEVQTRNVMEHIAEIKYALFPLQCFSLSEGPQFNINFSHHVELESPGKGGKEFLLFISKCRIKGNRFKCEFCGTSPVISVGLNGKKQDTFKGNHFLFKISCLRTGNNEVRITTVSDPVSQVKLVVCAYRVHYRRSFFAHSAENLINNSLHY